MRIRVTSAGWFTARLARALVGPASTPLILVGTVAVAGFAAAALNAPMGQQTTVSAGATSASVAQSASPSRWQSYAGRWELHFLGHCDRSIDENSGPCDSIMGGDLITSIATIDIVSDAQGQFTFEAQRLSIGEGDGPSPQCSGDFENAPSVTGVCRETAHGRGEIADMGSGPVFWADPATTTFAGRSVVRDVRWGNAAAFFGRPLPAVPGYYDTAGMASILSGGPAFPGLQLTLLVTHLAAG
jgi:hypothetical protein